MVDLWEARYCWVVMGGFVFFFQAEDGIRDAQESRGLGDVYKRQHSLSSAARTMPKNKKRGRVEDATAAILALSQRVGLEPAARPKRSRRGNPGVSEPVPTKVVVTGRKTRASSGAKLAATRKSPRKSATAFKPGSLPDEDDEEDEDYNSVNSEDGDEVDDDEVDDEVDDEEDDEEEHESGDATPVEAGGDVLTVKCLDGKRINKAGQLEYRVVWADSHPPSWEPTDNISEDLMEEFEASAAAEQEYVEVLKLVEKRSRAGQTEYKVEWEGEFMPSWEPAQNITDDLIQEFEAAQRKPTKPLRAALKPVKRTKTAPAPKAAAPQRRTRSNSAPEPGELPRKTRKPSPHKQAAASPKRSSPAPKKPSAKKKVPAPKPTPASKSKQASTPQKQPSKQVEPPTSGLLEVERLVDKRRRGDKVEYKVLWASARYYPTWEASVNITGDLIQEFEDERRAHRPKQVRNKIGCETNSSRQPYTPREDEMIVDHVKRCAGQFVAVTGGRYGASQSVALKPSGNIMWKQACEGELKELAKRHTWQSMRERYIRHLS
eukprot:TRINITY_DN11624_c0_g1_i1.p1 TRINITY_DN11624_c0_g1~~TRINITY_DN11624_c0_g1_i1.p1  ORF type:complete len:547 (+),score=137.91 TRINITY_DN11624_c0_g1_i1:44-1684(+)